jgi:peptidoglycan/LPS O-acetylase OafA/YrhL
VLVLPLSISESAYYDGGNVAVAVLAGLLVVHLAGGASGLAGLLSWPPLVWVGRRSYGIYLWSLPVAALVKLLPLPTAPRGAATVALTLVVPAVSYRLLEEPMLRLRHRLDHVGPLPADQPVRRKSARTSAVGITAEEVPRPVCTSLSDAPRNERIAETWMARQDR